jgi:alpha-ketoglutarate-dependent taurine dioxygenase
MDATTRLSFDSTNNLSDFLVNIDSVKNMTESQKELLLNKFNTYGACLIEHKECQDPKSNLLELKKYFGNIIGHDRADEDGITKIANLKGFDGYLGASFEEHPLHTGGIYSENPPIIILLQCIKQSSTGGDSILVSSKLIYNYLLNVDPEGLEKIKEHGTVTMKRGDAMASRPIFDKDFLGNNSYMFSFRCDNVVEFILKPSSTVKTLGLIKNFIDDPKNQLRFRLKKNQIMIADNSAVMHARTAFPENEDRCLLRLTLDGKCNHENIVLGFR